MHPGQRGECQAQRAGEAEVVGGRHGMEGRQCGRLARLKALEDASGSAQAERPRFAPGSCVMVEMIATLIEAAGSCFVAV